MLHIISDIHLEHNPEFKVPYAEHEESTVIALIGDIAVVTNAESFSLFKDMMVDLADRFYQVLYVPGNHEYYGSNITTVNAKLDELFQDLPSNCTLLQNKAITIDGVDFFGSTMWTDCNNPFASIAWSEINDSKKIRHGDKETPYEHKLSIEDTYALHKEATAALFEHLAQSSNKTVVLSHHGVVYRPDFDPYGYSNLTQLFYSLHTDDLFLQEKISMIGYGHTHSFLNTTISHNNGETVVASNPLGYCMANTCYDRHMMHSWDTLKQNNNNK